MGGFFRPRRFLYLVTDGQKGKKIKMEVRENGERKKDGWLSVKLSVKLKKCFYTAASPVGILRRSPSDPTESPVTGSLHFSF
jgi:hypothetical protein